MLGAVACGDTAGGGETSGTGSDTASADDVAMTSPTASGSPTTSPPPTTSTTVDPDTTVGPGGSTESSGGSTGSGSTAGPSTGSTDGGSTDGGSTDGDTGSVAPPCPYDPVPGNPSYSFEVVGYGFPALPVQVVGDPTTPDRLFVPTQFGRIFILEPGEPEAPAEAWLDLTDEVHVFNEGALCSLEFHPDYPEDPRVYVYYSAEPDGRTRIEEFVIDPDTLAPVDPGSGTTILELFNDTGTHYGGMMHFDADGWLVVGLGDGSDTVSPLDPMALHSKFIRIGVEPDGTPDNPITCAGCPQFGPFDYTIPGDNPFVNDPDVADEVFAMGFRNPWRWYFHPDTGDIFAGDVGLESWEEMNLVRPGNHYGWSALEGNNCYGLPGCDLVGPGELSADGYVAPLIDYPHDPGCAVIGGPVYQSCEVPAWNGTVFYGDLCSSGISALRWENEALEDLGLVYPPNIGPRGSGTNAWGEVFFTGGLFAGEIHKLVPGK